MRVPHRPDLTYDGTLEPKRVTVNFSNEIIVNLQLEKYKMILGIGMDLADGTHRL